MEQPQENKENNAILEAQARRKKQQEEDWANTVTILSVWFIILFLKAIFEEGRGRARQRLGLQYPVITGVLFAKKIRWVDRDQPLSNEVLDILVTDIQEVR